MKIDVLSVYSLWPKEFLRFGRIDDGSEERTKRTEENKHQADRDCYESEEWSVARSKKIKE
jgi:hypothetical protein